MAVGYEVSDGARTALSAARNIRASIPGWRRTVALAQAELSDPTPDFARVERTLADPDAETLRGAAQKVSEAGEHTAGGTDALVGEHAGLLVRAVDAAATSWDQTLTDARDRDAIGVAKDLATAESCLERAMQHALFLTFLADVSAGHLGESFAIADYCAGWGLSATSLDSLWAWFQQDPCQFDGSAAPVALDTVNRIAYRKARTGWEMSWSASASVWGAAGVYLAVAILFAVLHAAGVTKWPGLWGWKLLVLVLFTSFGALAHVGSKALNVKYDNPMKVYDAGNLLDWLSLRWIAILRLYLPVAFVVAGLWGAGNIPTSFKALSTALLAGYSADSLFGAAISKLNSQATKSESPVG